MDYICLGGSVVLLIGVLLLWWGDREVGYIIKVKNRKQ